MNMDSANIQFSYQDLKLVLALKELWLNALEADSSASNTIELSEEQKAATEAASTATAEAVQDIVQQGKQQQQHVDVIIVGIELRLLNDCYEGAGSTDFSSPIATFRLSELKVLLEDWSTLLNGNLKLSTLEASYFNDKLNTEEPLLEPWNMMIDIMSTADTGMQVCLI
jgi:hypothetical protein